MSDWLNTEGLLEYVGGWVTDWQTEWLLSKQLTHWVSGLSDWLISWINDWVNDDPTGWSYSFKTIFKCHYTQTTRKV